MDRKVKVKGICPICGSDLPKIRRKDKVYCSQRCKLRAWARRSEAKV